MASETYSFLKLQELILAKQLRRQSLVEEIARLDAEMAEGRDLLAVELVTILESASVFYPVVTTTEHWITAREAAVLKDVTYQTVLNWIANGRVEFKKEGRRYLLAASGLPERKKRRIEK